MVDSLAEIASEQQGLLRELFLLLSPFQIVSLKMSKSAKDIGNIQNRENAIYIGNIPFDSNVDDLIQIFEKLGNIRGFRAPTDPETGKLRGFAFLEFDDKANVQLAMKHFIGTVFNGRPLRIDCASKPEQETKVFSTDINWGVDCDPKEAPQKIAQVINGFSPEMIQTILVDMGQCMLQNPQETRRFLHRNPQLAYGLLLCAVRAGKVTKDEAQSMLYEDTSTTALYPAPSSSQHFQSSSLGPPPPPMFGAPTMLGPPPPFPGAASGINRSPKISSSRKSPKYRNTPGSSTASPMDYEAARGSRTPDGDSDAAKAQLFARLQSMTKEDFDKLPVDTREKLLKLKASFSS